MKLLEPSGHRFLLVLSHHLMHYKKEAIVLIIRKILTKYIDHDPKFLIFTNANPVKRIDGSPVLLLNWRFASPEEDRLR